MPISMSVCHKCCTEYSYHRRRPPCNLDEGRMDILCFHNIDIGEDPRPGCDKLFEHAVSVNIDTTGGADVDNRRDVLTIKGPDVDNRHRGGEVF